MSSRIVLLKSPMRASLQTLDSVLIRSEICLLKVSCADAATQIIHHQSDLYDETLLGGQLYKYRWYISSLASHDFLLAAMVLCLELSWKTMSDLPNLHPGSMSSTPKSQEEMLTILETSYNIWTTFGETSTEARKASKALALMLPSAKRNHPRSRDKGEEPMKDQRRRLRDINRMSLHTLFQTSNQARLVTFCR